LRDITLGTNCVSYCPGTVTKYQSHGRREVTIELTQKRKLTPLLVLFAVNRVAEWSGHLCVPSLTYPCDIVRHHCQIKHCYSPETL